MARQHQSNLFVLPWDEQGNWVFEDALSPMVTDVCSVPELHSGRNLLTLLRCTIRIARRIRHDQCVITWESSTAIAASIALRLIHASNPHIALGIIPKIYSRPISRLLTMALRKATIVTCFSHADFPVLRSLTGVDASGVTPTVWRQSVPVKPEYPKHWVAVGASNRDDVTLSRAAENAGINIDRYGRQVTLRSSAYSWHLNATDDQINAAFSNYRFHFAILQSSNFTSGLSIAVRAGFGRQVVIASDTPHMRELVTHDSSGLLVTVGDIASLSDVISALKSGEINTGRLSENLYQICCNDHTYSSLRRHIEQMVTRCM